MNETKRRLYPLPEAAELLGVGRSTIYELIGAGALASVKIGRRTLVPAEAIDRYIAGLTDGSGDESR